MNDQFPAPNEGDFRAYLQGTLPADRFAAVDAWIAHPATQAEVERLLALAEPLATTIPALERTQPSVDVFAVDAPRGRLIPGVTLGEGGMGVVRNAHDRALQRTVALKILRPRQPSESLEEYLVRESAFRREAVMTANLEHPAIVPLYEVGTVGGNPAFTMKRVEGRSFEAVAVDGTTPLAELIKILQRVAEAVAFAHHEGIVHRDLTPANILVGEYGAVYVLDWGLAEHIGTLSSIRAGTPAWMAPEQHEAVPTSARMDVFGLGGLLMYALTKQGPRVGATTAGGLNLLPLDHSTIPPGLAAVARRCLAADPTERYATGEAVAAELLRWQEEGLTLAQQVNRFQLWWLRLRRSPHLMSALVIGSAALLCIALCWWWMIAVSEQRAQNRIAELAKAVALDRPEPLDLALSEVRSLRRDFPSLTAAAQLESRFSTAREVIRQMVERERLRERMNALLARTRQIGPWVNQVTQWREVLLAAGLVLDGQHQPPRADEIALLRRSEDAQLLAQALAMSWRAEREQGGKAGADATARLLANVGPTPGWRALGRVLTRSEFRAHDPVLGTGSDADAILAEPEPAASALALFAPQRQLEDYARRRLEIAPGDFWSLIAAGRAALAAHDVHESQHLALIASGAEPGSLLPCLILAYVALEQKAWSVLSEQAERGLGVDLRNVELRTLQAIALTYLNRRQEAERILAQLPAGHLRFHQVHRVGHPMELAVDALVAAGLKIPDASPDLGPLTPARDQHGFKRDGFSAEQGR